MIVILRDAPHQVNFLHGNGPHARNTSWKVRINHVSLPHIHMKRVSALQGPPISTHQPGLASLTSACGNLDLPLLLLEVAARYARVVHDGYKEVERDVARHIALVLQVDPQ